MIPSPHKSSRISHPPKKYLGILTEDLEEAFLVGDRDIRNDPKIYDEVILDVDSEKWMDVMKLEIDSIHSNQVWSIVDPLEGIVPIRCKWIYKRKIGSNGKVEIYKARLVAKGYSPCKGIDYHEIFLPVAILKSIHTLLAIATFYDYKI